MASVMAHLAACQAAATIVDPCTGARGANLPLDLRRGQPAGAHVLSKRSQRWMRLVLPTGWPGSISLRNDRSPTQKGTGTQQCSAPASAMRVRGGAVSLLYEPWYSVGRCGAGDPAQRVRLVRV